MIEFRRTRTIVTDPLPKLIKTLGFKVGVWDPGRHCHKFIATTEFDNGDIAIPYNLPLNEFLWATNRDQTANINLFIPFKKVEYKLKKGVDWHPKEYNADVQKQAFSFLMENKHYPRKMLNMTTGTGKTFVALKYMVEMGYKTMIIVDQLTLGDQWIKKGIAAFIDIKEDDYIFLNSVSSFEGIIHKNDHVDKKIFVTTYKSLSKLIDKNKKYFERVIAKLQIGLKIFDEAHLEMYNLFKIDSVADVNDTIYLTATPNRSNPDEDTIIKYILPFECSFSNNTARDKYHHIMIAEYKTKPTLEEEYTISSKNKYGFSVNAWCEYIMEKHWDIFSTGLFNFLEDAYIKSFKKTVILFKQKEMIVRFAGELKLAYPNKKIGLFINIKGVSKLHKNEELDTDIILTTDKSFTTGIDATDIVLAINTISYSSDVVSVQTIGRLRDVPDQKVLYVDYVDIGFEKIRKQKLRRLISYRKVAKKIYLNYKVRTTNG